VPYSAEQLARDPGYLSRGNSQTLYFGARGAGEFESATVVDLALQYSVPVWRTLEPWVKFELRNVFDEDSLVTYDTTISPDFDGPVDADGLPTSFVRGPNFGQATSEASHVVPRAFQLSLGLRF